MGGVTAITLYLGVPLLANETSMGLGRRVLNTLFFCCALWVVGGDKILSLHPDILVLLPGTTAFNAL